eukprot:m.352079 g.352079  ORF g.352079 m.352079 type:complete len:191 (-) comp55908_c0_seq24:116-688(-)
MPSSSLSPALPTSALDVVIEASLGASSILLEVWAWSLRIPRCNSFGPGIESQYRLQPGLACCCRRLRDRQTGLLTELHLLNCQNFGILTEKHDAIKETLVTMLKAGRLRPDVEPCAGVDDRRRLRFDIAVDRADASKHQLFAAVKGAAVVESFGALHPEFQLLIANVSQRVSNLPPDGATFTAPSFVSAR